MKNSQELAILIKKYLSFKAVWCTKAVEWIAWQWLESWKHRHAEDNPQDGYNCPATRQQYCVHRGAMDDLVLSQEDKPKRHQSAREISYETAILRSSVHRIIHRDLQLKCFKRCRVQLLSEANRISRLTRW